MQRSPSFHASVVFLICCCLGLGACGEDSPGMTDGSNEPERAPTPVPSTSPVTSPYPPQMPVLVLSSICLTFPGGVGESVSGSIAGSVKTSSGGDLTFSLITQPVSGAVSMASAGGAFTFTPSQRGLGFAATFDFRVTDAAGGTATASATIIYGTRRIWPLGDSITYGLEGAIGDDPGTIVPPMSHAVGYRKRLRDMLIAGGYAVDFVGTQSAGAGAGLDDPQHDGFLGATTEQIDARIGSGLMRTVRPDVILLHAGTNDTINGSADIASLASILARANDYASNANDNPVGVALAKIIDQRPDSPTVNRVARFNQNVTAMYDDQWADMADDNVRFKVRLADHFAAIDPSIDLAPLTRDDLGLHPNAAGYDKMARVWFDTLVAGGLVSKCP